MDKIVKYDENGHLIHYKTYNENYRYKYDKDGHLVYKEDIYNETYTSYKYDENGRLIYMESTEILELVPDNKSNVYWEKYTYDENGNEIYCETSNGYLNNNRGGQKMNKENLELATKLTTKVINFKDKDFDLKSEPFWVQDAYGWCDDIFDSISYCNAIFITKEFRNKGIGSELLQNYIKENIGDDKLFFIQAGFSKDEYTKEEFENATSEERNALFYKLDKFYTKNGFFNINDYIGDYENSQMYLYTNEAAIKLMKNIIKIGIPHKLFSLIAKPVNIDDKDILTVRKKDGTYKTYTTFIKQFDDGSYKECVNTSRKEINEIAEVDYAKANRYVKLNNGLAIKIIKSFEYNLIFIFIIKIKDNIIDRKDYWFQIV